MGRCCGNQFLLALSTKLVSGDIRRMALAYDKKCMGVAGRRRLVAEPGGLTLGFELRLVQHCNDEICGRRAGEPFLQTYRSS